MDTMKFILWYILGSVLYTECIAGIIINLVIVVANIKKWKTIKTFPIGDKILSSVAISRALYLFHSFLVYLTLFVDLWDEKNLQVTSLISVVTMFLHFTNLWFATVLCVFYCVKITTYNWKFFTFLKTKISTLVPRFFLACLLISVSCSLPFGWYIHGMQMYNPTNHSVENMTLSIALVYENSFIMFLLVLIGSSLPFLVFLVANCLLLHSLCMHTRRMRSSGSSFRSPNLETHFNAVKSMSLFLMLQTIYFIISSYTYILLHGNMTAFMITSIITCSPPCLHSLYIISSNSQLKTILISMFHVLACCPHG